MFSSTASLDSLSSPSPSPPPTTNRKTSTLPVNTRGLDSSSSLSDLTEDEQENNSQQIAESSTQQSIHKSVRRKRGGIVPPEPWDWAMKKKVNVEHDDNRNDAPYAENVPSRVTHTDGVPIVNRNAVKEVVKTSTDSVLSKGLIPDVVPSAAPSTVGEVESEDEDALSPSKNASREGSLDLTDVEEDTRLNAASDEDKSDHTDSEGWSSGPDEEDDEAEADPPIPRVDDVDANADDDQEPADNIGLLSVTDLEPVVPTAPAGSSIMAGQQLIKTPTPTPSPSSSRSSSVDPEQVQLGFTIDEIDKDADLDLEAKEEPDAEVDLADGRDMDAASEIGGEENELDMQPAHRAEALDVLAGIELKFALLREKLYVEKMEDLALEETMVIQGTHPEMIYLQTELQNRHDRRLQLALKRRRYEEECVLASRKAEENAIWSWWKFERDDLQSKMFTEVNRKKRRIERERRIQDRPIPPRRLPVPTPIFSSLNNISIRDIVKSVPFDRSFSNSRSKRKRGNVPIQRHARPTLQLLSPQEIQSDLQFLTSRRPIWAQQVHPELNSGSAMGVPQEYGNYMGDPYVHGSGPSNVPSYPPYMNTQLQVQPLVQGGYIPGNEGRAYRIQNAHSATHVQQRPMQGPGQPILHSGMPNMVNHAIHGQDRRRSISPPPLAPSHDYRSIAANGNHAPPTENAAGAGAYDWSSLPGGSKQTNLNGWDGRRISSSGRNGRHADGRDTGNDWDVEREQRERESNWQSKSHKDDEHQHLDSVMPLQQAQQPHRHTMQHQSLQGIPHHHHILHHHHKPHYLNSHLGSASGPAQSFVPRRHEHEHLPPQPSSSEMTDVGGRRFGSTSSVETINLIPKPISTSTNTAPFWKQDEQEFARDRGRPSGHILNATSGSHHLSPPSSGLYDRDRPQATSFVMTPSQVVQSGYSAASAGQNTARRDPWEDNTYLRLSSGSVPSASTSAHLPQNSSPLDHNFRAHSGVPTQTSHQYNTQNRQSPQGLSPRRIAPASPPPTHTNQLHSPSRQQHQHSASAHLSPRPPSSAQKTPRPLSPTPIKTISSTSTYGSYGQTSGPGAPSATDTIHQPNNLHGPGTRPSDNFMINGHIPMLPPAPRYPSPSFSGTSSSQIPNTRLGSPHVPPPPAKVSIV